MAQLKYVVTDQNAFALTSTDNNIFVVASVLKGNPVGAGRCELSIHKRDDIDLVHVRCFGRSVGLDLDPRPEDAQIISRYINGINGI